MNISQLPYFIAIASTGSLSAASKKTNVSQPALSKYLDQLESEYGLAFFTRNKKKYILTPAGQIYLRSAQQILELVQHTRKAVSADSDEPELSLRLGVSPNKGIEAVSAVYAQLNNRYTSLHMSFQEGFAYELVQLLRSGRIDAFITSFGTNYPEDLQILPLRKAELVLALPSFYLPYNQGDCRLQDLPFAELEEYRESVFILPEPASSMYSAVQALFQNNHFHPRVSTVHPNLLMQEAIIRSGSSIGLFPSFNIRPHAGLAYMRLHKTAWMHLVYATERGRELSEFERYLIYLLLEKENFDGMEDTDPLRGIIEEFSLLPLISLEGHQ